MKGIILDVSHRILRTPSLVVDAPFNPDFIAGKYKAIQSNKDRILHISTGFVGNTIFWKPNYFAEENDVQYEIISGKKIKKSDKYNFKYYFYS